MKYIYILALLVCSVCAYTQDSAWIKSHYYKSERYITMRDGVRLFTSMYIPNDSSEKHPILLTRTPYSCAPYGEDKWRSWWNRVQREYFKEGYIMVIQDMRGRYMSEGEFHIIPPYIKDKKSKTDVDESSDTYDAIDWLVKNVPGNSGKVGVVGISYPGFAATEASLSGHPGKIEDVKLTMNDVAHTFKKGHRIMVQIQSSWFPLVDRNPQQFVDIYRCSDTDFQKATIKIYHDASNASLLVLPVLR